MEGFTLVLIISWFILVGCFAAMYFMDKATAEARAKYSSEPQSGASGAGTSKRT